MYYIYIILLYIYIYIYMKLKYIEIYYVIYIYRSFLINGRYEFFIAKELDEHVHDWFDQSNDDALPF